ncbi:MAG TPA: carboxypeptidase-like regulatory domain-containing protein, partial [Terriglobales bacterium]|nr:carboxypeptidase-like regulatory domain-containing protein [Terriglobales bacterium]
MDRRLGFLPVLFLATSGLISAQARLGSISGTVRDSAGVPQMGAAVELLASAANAATAIVYTDSRGRYSATRLPAGHYQVKASQASFLPTLRENVALRSGAAVVVNLTLNTVFEALQIMPMRGRTQQDDDDWKWTLRSMANRPIL